MVIFTKPAAINRPPRQKRDGSGVALASVDHEGLDLLQQVIAVVVIDLQGDRLSLIHIFNGFLQDAAVVLAIAAPVLVVLIPILVVVWAIVAGVRHRKGRKRK